MMRRTILYRKWVTTPTSDPFLPGSSVAGDRAARVEMPDAWPMTQMLDGFWVDKDGEIGVASKIAYWIPPSQILNVEIVE